MDIHEVDTLLTTTRSVRKRLDFSRPVPRELIEECLEIAVQAPTAKNAQAWRFIVVVDPEQRAALGAVYKRAFLEEWGSLDAISEPVESETSRMMASVRYLVEHISKAPALVIFCTEAGLVTDSLFELSNLFGTIMPAAWSFMLAARSRGLGCCWTNIHLLKASEAARLLRLPSTITQAVLMPVAYYLGREFKPARRKSARSLTFWNYWEHGRSMPTVD
jgi:nitroreductase